MGSYSSGMRQSGGHDMAESAIRRADTAVQQGTGVKLLHWLTFGSIAASVGLFLAGKKNVALLVGLWPPTFQALRGNLMRGENRTW